MADKIDIQQIVSIMWQMFTDSSKQLVFFLEKMLPLISEDWWNKAVLDNLSFDQQRRIKQRKNNFLASLDLIALLRVLEKNWYCISNKLNLSSESFNFIKEMQTIRNRWAHPGTQDVPIEDLYRDLDTLQRFLIIINGDPYLLQNIKTIKSSLLSGIVLGNNDKEVEKKKRQGEKINKDILLESIDQPKENKINGKNLTKIEIAVQKMSKGWITPEELQQLCGFKDLHNLKMAVSIKANPKRTKHPIKLEKKVIDGRMHWRIAKD